MLISNDFEIQNSRVSIDSVFLVKDIEQGFYSPLFFKEPVGHYTLDPKAIYCGRKYTLGFKIENITLAGKLNIYGLELSHGRTLNQPYYNADLGLLVVDVYFNESIIPTINEMGLPDTLWTMCTVHLTINDLTVPTNAGDLVTIPLSFNVNHSTIAGDGFYNSDKAFMVVQPHEILFLDITSGSGGGAGVNLIKGENKSGGHGGDATLCYIEPETGLIKPIVFVEGGLGGRLSSNTHQVFKKREAKTRAFIEGYINHNIYIEVVLKEHNLPSTELTKTNGGDGHLLLNNEISAPGGDGGIKDEIGYRGEGGMSGGRAVVHVRYKLPIAGEPGPFIILHPKTMVNVFDIIKDKDLKIKKTKKPMVGGEGGFSLTQPGSNGLDGKFIVSI